MEAVAPCSDRDDEAIQSNATVIARMLIATRGATRVVACMSRSNSSPRAAAICVRSNSDTRKKKCRLGPWEE